MVAGMRARVKLYGTVIMMLGITCYTCRLLEALQRGPRRQHLALPLFLLVAQQRQIIMVREG
jgi:hypothetical protein